MGRPPFDVFNAESEVIEFYLERLQEYFTAYDIRNDTDSPAKRRAILLTSLGSGAYRVLKDLFLLDKYKDSESCLYCGLCAYGLSMNIFVFLSLLN